MNERVAIRMKANADNFLNERNQQKKMLDRAMRGLDLERNYILKHMDLDKKVFEKRYQQLQSKASKIKSNLTAKQITRLRKQEFGMEVESSSEDEDTDHLFMTEQDVQIVDIVDEGENINTVSDENNNLINDMKETELQSKADVVVLESINNHPIMPILEEESSDQIYMKSAVKKGSAKMKDSSKGRKQSSARMRPESLVPVRETKVKIIEPAEEALITENGSVVKLPAANTEKLKPAMKLQRSQSYGELGSSSQLSSSLPAIPMARGLSQSAPGNKSARKAHRSSTADALNWTYTSGMFSCHNSRKNVDYSSLGEKLSGTTSSTLDTSMDIERDELRQLLEKEKRLNQVLIKKRKGSLFRNIEETIAITNAPPVSKATPDLLDAEERSPSTDSGRLVSRAGSHAESHTDSNVTDDLNYLRDEIRRKKMDRFRNRDRKSSKLNLYERKEGESDEAYDNRIAAWRKEMKKCRYVRSRGSIDLSGVQTLVAEQHNLRNIWEIGIQQNLFE